MKHYTKPDVQEVEINVECSMNAMSLDLPEHDNGDNSYREGKEPVNGFGPQYPSNDIFHNEGPFNDRPNYY